MNPTAIRRKPLNHLALALALGVGLGAATAQAQTILDVGEAGTIGTTTLTTGKVPAGGVNWTVAGGESGNGGGGIYSGLVSTTATTVAATGNVTLTFDHTYNFESGWDGAAVFVRIDGGAFTYLDGTAFSAGGYVGDTLTAGSSAWSGGENVFYNDTPDNHTSTTIQSVADLGDWPAGTKIAVEFRSGWDEGTTEAAPNWVISTVKLTDGGANDILDVDFTADGSSGFTVADIGTVAGPWKYLQPINRFEIDADAASPLEADKYVPAVAGSVIDLNGADLEVVLLTGTLDIGDTFALFDLSGGTTLTGAINSITLPPGIWDVSKLAVDGTITLRLMSPLFTPGADFEVNARSDNDGNDIWEDRIGKTGIEFFLDTANGVNRVATGSSTRLPYAYAFPGGFSGDTAPNSDEAGYGGAKLVRTGDPSGECYSFGDGPQPTAGWNAQDVTIEIWFKPGNLTPTPANGQILFEDGGGIGFGLFLANNQLVTSQDNNEVASRISYDLSTDPSGLLLAGATSEFIQAVLTRTAGGHTEMFVNGVSVGTSEDGDTNWSGGDGFGLGARGEANAGGRGGTDASTESFNGQIALFRVYNNQILTPSEVANNFADLAGPDDPYMAVTLTSPSDTEAIPSGTSIMASATITDPGTTPYAVEFWIDGGLAGTATTADPYTLDLGVLADGSHEVYVKVTDSSTPAPLIATSETHVFTVAPATGTTTTLASSANPSIYGAATVTATVVANNSSTLTGGTVQFYDGGDPLGSPVAVDTATGEASYSINTLGVGTHPITADYSGHGVHGASSALALSQVVDKAPLTVTANNVFRPTGTANLDPLPYTITGYQNGEDLASSGVTGEPLLTTAAVPASPVGDYTITCALGSLAADNYSLTSANGTLTVADVPDTFSVNFFVGPDWPYGGLTTDEQKANVKVDPGMPAGLGDWYTNGWLNYLVPWAPTAPRPPVTMTSNRGSTATFTLNDCRNGSTYDGPRTTLLGDGNGNMMDAHVNSTLDPGDGSFLFDMEVSGIPFAVYDVIFYMGANKPQFGDGKGVIEFNGGAERAFTLKPGAFDGTFTEMVDATTPGNYLVFTGVTGSSFTTRTWGTGPTGFNHVGPFGFQIKAAAADYGTWAEQYQNADLSDPEADFDGDGWTNDEERLFGLDPTSGASVNPISAPLNAGAFSFTRRDNALTGKFTDIETSTDLVLWTVDAEATLVDNGPDANGVEIVNVTLSEGLLAAPKLFVRVSQRDALTPLSENFESGDGGFTILTTSGSDWAWGVPDSEGPGGSVTGGNGGTGSCWGTNLGTWAGGTGNPGYYINPSVTCLRSAEVDLTNVAAAELTFAEALDLAPGDSAVVNIIESATDAPISSAIYTATDPDALTAWAPANGGTPIRIPDLAIGKKVRIEWCLSGQVAQYFGWYIDDVTVQEIAP